MFKISSDDVHVNLVFLFLVKCLLISNIDIVLV
jgi:hypothetical protein